MTREKAIEVLEYARNYDGMGYGAPSIALDMAISALGQQETVTSGEIALNAKTMTLDDAIAHLDDTLSDTGRKWSCESCRMEHVQLRAWLAELREIKQERNVPLTLDELWKIYEASEPVYLYIFDSNIDSGWEIIEQITDRKIIFRGSMGVYVPIKELGVSYNLYRQKPEEGTI